VVRLVRSVVLSIREQGLCGSGSYRRQPFRQGAVPPHPANTLAPLIVCKATYICAAAILIESCCRSRRRYPTRNPELGKHHGGGAQAISWWPRGSS